ncbi:MAG: response regulator [Methylobacterium sp.]|uniref:response regulator n=1 Tax=Methylobacterium sp. TaxID=409 RepID=UPI002582633A|nr:response regulator [Methylobacterium sp.]MBY0295368.1 response regulator [Methylobacterium sp.]
MGGERTASVLVVEDEMLLLDLVTAELEDAGLSVIQASDGESALAVLESDAAVDLLFTDIRLPGRLDGWHLAEAARNLRPDLKVIYATGFSSNAPRLLPDSLFFSKPYRPSVILAAIRKFGLS